MDKTCRICFCLEEDINNPLISPCRCRGTCQFIHRECLKQYRTYGSLRDFYRCGVCKTDYQMKKEVPPLVRMVTSPLFLNVFTTILVMVLLFFFSCIPIVEYPWTSWEGHVYNLGVFSLPLVLLLLGYTVYNGGLGNDHFPNEPLHRGDRMRLDIRIGRERNYRRNAPERYARDPTLNEKLIIMIILMYTTALFVVMCDKVFYLIESLVRYLFRDVHRDEHDIIEFIDSSESERL